MANEKVGKFLKMGLSGFQGSATIHSSVTRLASKLGGK